MKGGLSFQQTSFLSLFLLLFIFCDLDSYSSGSVYASTMS